MKEEKKKVNYKKIIGIINYLIAVFMISILFLKFINDSYYSILVGEFFFMMMFINGLSLMEGSKK